MPWRTAAANCLFLHVTLVPYIAASQEMKTKPTQHSVKELLSLGLQPDIIVCRAERPLTRELKDKIALFCNVKKDCVIENCDVPLLYQAPLELEKQGLADIVCREFGLEDRQPDLSSWKEMVERLQHPSVRVTIALVGKYVELHDAYLSVAEALKHGGIPSGAEVNILWVDSEQVTPGDGGKPAGRCGRHFDSRRIRQPRGGWKNRRPSNTPGSIRFPSWHLPGDGRWRC